jgi:diguanylate cyclase (GGDEF)-like protein/PAS domain S-box-containing protein
MFKQLFTGLRGKMLLIASLGLLLMFALIYFGARYILLDGYAQLEKEKTELQINSAMSLINEQAEQLSVSVLNNAHWDAIYDYMDKPSVEFTNSNMNATTHADLKVNVIFIVDNDGKIVFKSSMDYKSLKPLPIPVLLSQEVKSESLLINSKKQSISGLFWTQQGIYVVSSIDILNSLAKGQRKGSLIMARLLDDSLIEHVGQIVDAKLNIQSLGVEEIESIAPDLLKNQKAIKPLSNGQVGGFALVKSINTDYKLILTSAGDRKIYQQGKDSLKFMYLALGLISLLLAMFSWFLDKLVLTRLARLSLSVKKIGESSTRYGRVIDLSGDDEINSLAHGINGMLGRLDESQAALQFEKDRAQVTLAGIADAVITCDIAGSVLYMNKAAERLTGVQLANVDCNKLQTLFHLMSEDKITPVDSNWLTDAASNLDEVLLQRMDGQEFIISKSTSPLLDANKVPFGNVTVLHDVTMLRALSNQLNHQARYDSLTGLINRYEFDRKTQAMIEDSLSSERVHCLAYIDLDKFKVVNDTCGHMAGDLLLKQLADHMKTKIRHSDTLARLGGDEFAILLNGCNLEKAQEIVNGVLQAVQEYRFSCSDKVFKVGASIGLTEISSSKALNLSELLATVDSACYAAKNEGGNRINVYHPDDAHMKDRINQLEWVSRINIGLEKNQFVLYAQSFKSLHNDEQHCELLIRMQSDKNTLYPPGAFLPAAERYHLMPQIDRWVINEAFRIIVSKGAKFKTVCAINLSGQSLSQDGFLDYVIQKIKEHKVNTKQLCFEITETAVITNLDKARQFMQKLRALGCRFSLDDFGSGLSSFAYLKNLDVDFLKIDGMFVKSIANNKIDRAMVESINNIGHVMGLQTIAEFAENQEIVDVLKAIGVDYAQGYGVEMPKPFELTIPPNRRVDPPISSTANTKALMEA